MLVGLSGRPITIDDSTMFSCMRKQIRGHYGSEPQLVADLIALVRAGRLEFSKSVSGRMPLAQAAVAVARLERKEGNPIRLVLIP